MNARPVSVVKLGSSVLAGEADLPGLVAELAEELSAGLRVVAVVSARDGVTDRLDAEARRIAPTPDPHAYAALLATGEAHSVAALGLAAAAAGLRARSLDARELGLRTTGDPRNALPRGVRRRPLHAALVAHDVVVVPGFVGQDAAGRVTLLGRGGSDLTAIFLAHALGASRCRLLKDVPGWFVRDPAHGSTPRYRDLSWDDAIVAPAPIVQAKAVRFARDLGRPFEVAGLGGDRGTRVGPWPTLVEEPLLAEVGS